MLVNTSHSFEALGLGTLTSRFHHDRLMSCPATELALEHLGRPLPNAALLGGFAALTGQVTLEAVGAAVCRRYPGVVGEHNAAAAEAAHRFVVLAREVLDHASSD